MTRGFTRFAMVLVLALAGAVPASAEAAMERVRIVDFGLYETGRIHRIPDPEQLGGQRFSAEGLRLLEQTDVIPGQLGRVFGLRFRVLDPSLVGKPLQLRLRHPRLTEPSGRSATESGRRDAAWPMGESQAHLFTFDHTWEIAEGDWTLQIVHDGRVLAEKKFRVVVSMY